MLFRTTSEKQQEQVRGREGVCDKERSEEEAGGGRDRREGHECEKEEHDFKL